MGAHKTAFKLYKIYITCSSSIKRLAFCSFTHLIIYINMNLGELFHTLDYNWVLLYFVAQIIPILSLQKFLRFIPLFLWNSSILLFLECFSDFHILQDVHGSSCTFVSQFNFFPQKWDWRIFWSQDLSAGVIFLLLEVLLAVEFHRWSNSAAFLDLLVLTFASFNACVDQHCAEAKGHPFQSSGTVVVYSSLLLYILLPFLGTCPQFFKASC